MHPPFKSWSVCNFLKVVQTAARHCIEGVGLGPDCSMMKVDWLKEPACSSKRSNHGGGAKKKKANGVEGRASYLSLFLSFVLFFTLFSSQLALFLISRLDCNQKDIHITESTLENM